MKKIIEMQNIYREKHRKMYNVWKPIIEHKSLSPLNTLDKKMTTARLLENTRRHIKETTYTGDIANFQPILIPMVRRIMPYLLAMELFGNQPMAMPTGLVFGLRYGYAPQNASGTGVEPWADVALRHGVLIEHGLVPQSDLGAGPADPEDPAGQFTTALTTENLSAYRFWDPAGPTYLIQGTAGITAQQHIDNGDPVAVIVAVLSGKILCMYLSYDDDGNAYQFNPSNNLLFASGTGNSVNPPANHDPSTEQTGGLIGGAYNTRRPEAGFREVLADFSATFDRTTGGIVAHPTARGETLGRDGLRRQLGLYIEKKAIEAGTRWLSARYSIEAEQDLKAIHDLDLSAEFMNILSYEIGAEIDREMLFKAMAVAGVRNAQWDNTNITDMGLLQRTSAAGGTLVDNYRMLYSYVTKIRNAIAKATMRGVANWVVGTPDIIAIFEAMQGFRDINIDGSVKSTDFGVGYAGEINGVKFYKDLLWEPKRPVGSTDYLDEDYLLVGYKGDSIFDAGIFYHPYIPLQVEQTQGQESFEKVIGFQTRYAISDHLFGSEHFYSFQEFKTNWNIGYL